MQISKQRSSSEDQHDNPTWRNWWVIKHVLSELPLIDGICKFENGSEAFYYSSRSALTLIIGTIVMMANPFNMQMTDSMGAQGAKMAAAMGLGMTSGAVSHNLCGFFALYVRENCKVKDGTDTPLIKQFS